MAGGNIDTRMNARTRSFVAASESSPVVYTSVDDCGVNYRLRDGKLFRLNAREARQAGVPRFAHLVENA